MIWFHRSRELRLFRWILLHFRWWWSWCPRWWEVLCSTFCRACALADFLWGGSPVFSEYTESLRGTKANANAAQGLGEMLEIAINGVVTPNKKMKHEIDGANGWYRYESRFGLPVYSESGEVERYNVFHVYMIVRHDKNGRKYLYDIINIKKETSTPPSY